MAVWSYLEVLYGVDFVFRLYEGGLGFEAADGGS